jgi:hypothetical protein
MDCAVRRALGALKGQQDHKVLQENKELLEQLGQTVKMGYKGPLVMRVLQARME